MKSLMLVAVFLAGAAWNILTGLAGAAKDGLRRMIGL